MANRNYRAGSRIEYKARDELTAQGYAVIRSAGSHGIFDLWTSNTREILYVQLKRVPKGSTEESVRKLYKDEIFQARLFKNHPENARKEFWAWVKNGDWIKIRLEDS